MLLKEAIFKRKATRKYDMTPLDDSVLSDLAEFIETVKPLFEDIKIEYKILDAASVKSIFAIKAPHFIVISSENKDGYLTNAGFMFEQVCLYLSSVGLGSCWLGMAKPSEKIGAGMEYAVTLAFGKAIDSPHREITEFKRKPLAEISDCADERLEPARLAPSAVNSQPWYFVTGSDGIDVYCVKLGAVKALIYEKMNKVDIGIALSHLYIANTESFRFSINKNAKQIKGYYYVGSVIF